MKESNSSSPLVFGLNEALDDERAAAREQLHAAWRLQVERVEERLASGWAEHIERVIEERFSALARRVRAGFEDELAFRVREERARLRLEIGAQFNRTARRLRQCATSEELHAALLEEAAACSERTALFTFSAQNLKVVGERGFPAELASTLLRAEIPLSAAPAFANALESMDTVIAARTAGELSRQLALLLGEDAGRKCYLFPVISRHRVVAVLYAEGDHRGVETGFLEVLAQLAGAALDTRSLAAPAAAPGLVATGKAERSAARLAPADWAALSAEEQDLHMRAQRFGRVRVAEMRLYKAGAVEAGRARSDLYAELKQDIDSARETFRSQFAGASPSMVDYLHVELVRTLANNDDALLGPDYPGPIV